MFLVYLKKLWLATKAATYTGLSTSLNEILKIFTISVTLKFSKFVMQCHINNLYFGKVMFWHILTIALHIFSMQWSGVDLEGVQGVWTPPTPCQIWEVPFYLGFLGFWQIYLGFFHNIMVPFLSWTPPPPSEKLDLPQMIWKLLQICV